MLLVVGCTLISQVHTSDLYLLHLISDSYDFILFHLELLEEFQFC